MHVLCKSSGQWFAFATLLTGSVALGQMNTGEIAGMVKDPSGALLPGATIVAEQTATGLKFSTTSNSAGQYLLPGLAIGTYSLTVSAHNLKQSMLHALDRHVGELSVTTSSCSWGIQRSFSRL
jgi:hypothetical protein